MPIILLKGSNKEREELVREEKNNLETNIIYTGDCLTGMRKLPEESIQCCITSPPYWNMRDYEVDGQFGLQSTPEQYVADLVEIMEEVKRVLLPDGTLWLNLGDVYWGSGKAGLNPFYQNKHTEFGLPAKHNKRFGLPVTGKHREIKDKDLVGLPWEVALALRKAGWFLRQDIIWHKPNPMPESVRDRCTRAHEYIFLLSKNKKYYYDNVAIKTHALGKTDHELTSKKSKKALGHPLANVFVKEQGPYRKANRRSVWSIPTRPLKEAHFATFPLEIPERCILAGSRKGDIILDPFMGAGTTAVAALKNERRYVGFELNADYVDIAMHRLDLPFEIESAGRTKHHL